MAPEPEHVPVFDLGDTHVFKHYFRSDPVFHKLKHYYNNQQYRFEVPTAEMDDIRAFLKEYGYTFDVVRDTDPLVVVVRKYTSHPENIFKDSVMHRGRDGNNFFLMTDQIAVAEAVDGGAVRVTDTALANPFP